jgi:hypothetical protein
MRRSADILPTAESKNEAIEPADSRINHFQEIIWNGTAIDDRRYDCIRLHIQEHAFESRRNMDEYTRDEFRVTAWV